MNIVKICISETPNEFGYYDVIVEDNPRLSRSGPSGRNEGEKNRRWAEGYYTALVTMFGALGLRVVGR